MYLSSLEPCIVPAIENGQYFTEAFDPALHDASTKQNVKLLQANEEIQNGDIIDFQCIDGYNIQGPNQLKCWQGNWDSTTMPECIPAPCILPAINNAIYQVMYII